MLKLCVFSSREHIGEAAQWSQTWMLYEQTFSTKSESNVEFPTSFSISKDTNTRYCTHLHCGRLHHTMPQKGAHSQNKGYSYSAWLDSASHHDVPSIGVKILCPGSGSWSGAPTSRLSLLTDTLTPRSHV